MLNSLLTSLAVVLLPAFTPAPVESASCVSTDSVTLSLQFSGSHDAFDKLYQKLDDVITTHNGRINILHIGGSHVQAGEFSHTVRTRLTEMAPGLNGDHGLLFPFRAIKTNGPANYKLSYEGRWTSSRNVQFNPPTELGLSGAAAITSDREARLYLDLRENGKWAFDQLHIFGESSHRDVYPILITAKGDTIESTQTWMGHSYSIFDLPADGLNLQGYHFILPDTMSACTITFRGLKKVAPEPVMPKKKGAKKPEPNYNPLDSAFHFVLTGILPQSNRPGITYTESGVNGASLPSWLRCSEKHFTEELGTMPPDLVIFGIGINDANIPTTDFDPNVFKARYRQLIQRIRKVNPQATFIFITNNSCWYVSKARKKSSNPNTPRVAQAFRELAREYNAALFDVFAIQGGMGSNEAWAQAGLMQRDHLHFTRNGYILIGNLLYNAILADYLKYNRNKTIE